jgi:hypothetical protein
MKRREVGSNIRLSTEHLRRIEADSSRPSPGVLQSLIDLYDIEDPDRFWLLLARSHIPQEVLTHVTVAPRGLVSTITETVIEATLDWSELYFELEPDDQKYLRRHIQSKLE